MKFSKKKKFNWILLVIIVIATLAIILAILRCFNSGEDNWVRDSRGVFNRHGNPSNTPDYVKRQLSVISCANVLYEDALNNKMVFNSQCLGNCSDYSVDIAHSPRTSDDDTIPNQCADYRNGVTKHFIELDPDGIIIRIVD